MTSRRGGGQNVRLLRVGETIRHALSDILAREELTAPGFDVHRVTVSAVEISPDLRHADVFVVPMLDESSEATLAAMQRAASTLRYALARRVTLKYLPQLHFKLDRSFGEGDRIESILRSERVRRDIADGPDTE